MINKDFYRELNPIEISLLTEIEKIKIVDCHEHLMSEKDRVNLYVDAFTLFSHYTSADFVVSGMSESDRWEIFPSIEKGWKPQKSLDERFKLFKPFYENIKHSSYARAAHIAMKKFYNINELNEETVHLLSERIQSNNTQGLYDRVLKDACNMEYCMSQGCISDGDLMTSVSWVPNIPKELEEIKYWTGSEVGSFDDFLETISQKIKHIKDSNYIGVKQFITPLSSDLPNYNNAKTLFNDLKTEKTTCLEKINPFTDFIYDYIAKEVAKYDLVFCIHTGYWGDFRDLNPSYILPLASRNKDTKFDLYHLGYPYVKESIILGKCQQNIWLNMCWTYIISQKFAEDALYELLEMVPVNKILGFGGDYFIVEKIFGHLTMARESIARVLGKKIEEKTLSFDDSIIIARKILNENPKFLYNLK